MASESLFFLALTGNTKVLFYRVDLEDLSSVRSLAKCVIQHEPALHILVNNAGSLSAHGHYHLYISACIRLSQKLMSVQV